MWLTVGQVYVRTGGDWSVVAAGGGGNTSVNPPSALARYTYGGSKIGLTWAIGEPTAVTRVYRRPSAGSPYTLTQTVPAGQATTETGYTSGQFAVAHALGMNESVLVPES